MFLKRVITFLLTVIILFADSGQTIYAHTCFKTKRTHISIGQPKHCCSDKKATNHCSIKKSSCCEVSSKYLKQDFINQQSEFKQTGSQVAVFHLLQVFQLLKGIVSANQVVNISPHFALCKSEIAFTQTFRI